ncbi:MAG TPA: L-threonylcarbamoyladenylate synthase [Gemmataceae bacterium]|nr:L-threonylcarbamoyladenylate synthase [Gemmataceae bacterium]
MKTIVLTIDPNEPSAEAIAEAARVLRAGGLVAFPTETVYGLGANALDVSAVLRIFGAKGRPANNPLIVHVADSAAARNLATDWPDSAARLAARFWPGPLTLVLRRCDTVPDVVTASGPTVAVRVPAHPVAQALVRAAGVPIAAPSANRSTQLSPTRAEHVLHSLDGRIDLLLDGGPTTGGLESTVLDLTATPPRLLRPGLVGIAELESLLGPLTRAMPVGQALQPDRPQPLPSPGLLPRHYAPHTPLECVETANTERILTLQREGQRIGWVTFDVAGDTPSGVVRRVLPANSAGYAAHLYAVLHELDALGLDRIIVVLPPDTDDWLAVRDRLRRAATD